MPNVALHQARNAIFGIVLVLSFAVLGISAHWTSITVTVGAFFSFEGIGVAASGLSIIIVSTLLLVGILRKNATITIIGVELPAITILSVLFLAEGIVTNDLVAENFPIGCNRRVFSSFEVQVCKEFMALKSISFALFVIMAGYWVPLAIMTVIGLTQGRNILGQSVREVEFSARDMARVNELSGAIMGEGGTKGYDQNQHEQHQLQQIQLQQLQHQQAMLQQQQYMMHQQPQV